MYMNSLERMLKVIVDLKWNENIFKSLKRHYFMQRWHGINIRIAKDLSEST